MDIHVIRVAAALTVGGALTVVGPAAVAHANSCYGNVTYSDLLTVSDFSIVGYTDTQSIVEAEMVARMSPEDAQRFVDNPGNEGYFILWADDEWNDDEVARWEGHTAYPVVEGLLIRGTTTVPVEYLNEDSGPTRPRSPTSSTSARTSTTFATARTPRCSRAMWSSRRSGLGVSKCPRLCDKA